MSRVLVVDDEPDLRFLLRRALERAGYEVTDAHQGATAMAVAHDSPPDLVVTDMMMPVMGGVELIERLHTDPVTAAIPIVAVSGDTHLATEADAVLRKPFSPEQLVAVCDALLTDKGSRS
ncbi:response regulator [Pilimelia columellifera]|uniref:Response regulatory domain-containing protein n=1 Tax=Pilimelia columellifera subsp. columellifera TaxID=706583 RepID=A0ABN3N6P4_9ACTN